MDRLTFEATGELEGDTLRGVVHAFGQRTRLGGVWQEFAPTAFDQSLRKGDVFAFNAHNQSQPLAHMKQQTLRLAVVDGKLTYEMDLGAQTYAQDLRENVRAGLVRSMSFGVWPEVWKMQKSDQGETVRYHTRSALFEVSPVAMPAFAGTDAQLHAQAMESNASRLVRARHRVMEAAR
jgi:hypothetical protein